MKENSSHRIVLVTGSSRGIGYEIAKVLGSKGHFVILNSRHRDELESAVSTLKSLEIEATALLFDVSDFSDVKSGFEQIERHYGGVDILVNNAGIVRDRSFVKMSLDEWHEVIENNLSSVFYCCKLAISYMIQNQWGRIVNISSIVGQYGAFGQVNYAASKAGIIGFTKALAREVAGKGVTVNAVAPGYISTRMTSSIPATVLDKLKHRIPYGDLGNPSDVANMVAFLCSEAAQYITGTIINVDGGY